jgi:hypothetical protein
MWPLIHRHTTFQGWTKAATDRLGNFVQSLESSEHDLSPKSTWIQSLWIRQDSGTYSRDRNQVAYSTSNHVPVLREMIRKTLPPHGPHARVLLLRAPVRPGAGGSCKIRIRHNNHVRHVISRSRHDANGSSPAPPGQAMRLAYRVRACYVYQMAKE